MVPPMKTMCLSLLLAGSALAQVEVQISLPTIVFPAPPQLVVVAPGVEVVPDSDDEVFFVDRYYWHRRGPHWYRTNVHTGGWVLVEPRLVPQAIVALPPGKYRRWKREEKREEKREKREEHQEKKQNKHGKH